MPGVRVHVSAGQRLPASETRIRHRASDGSVLRQNPKPETRNPTFGLIIERTKPMTISPLAGKPADPSLLINVPRLVTAYYTGRPDPSVPAQRIVFGTSGHRGSALDNAFNEAHILAIAQAICLYRKQQNIDGPLYIGFDTHALSEPAFASAMEVL